jgi:hypothetical protein
MAPATHPAGFQRTAVFAGPSATDALNTGPWTRLPPASSGDFDAAIRAGFSRIIFADALFFDASPTHLEIMRALAAGIRVFGVSSSGALRAVELRRWGMIGSGLIYHLYRCGHLIDDGELASPLLASYGAAAPPLVQLRYYLGYAMESGIPQAAAQAAFLVLKNQYFVARLADVIQSVLRKCLGAAEADSLSPVSDPIFDVKALDLNRLLYRLASLDAVAGSLQPPPRTNMRWMRLGLRL